MLLKDVQNHQAAAILVEHMPKLSLSTLVELADTLTLPNDLMVTLETEIQERKDLAEHKQRSGLKTRTSASMALPLEVSCST